ncbi:hypothetical protein AWB71_05998 [Caballeronia peredens]|nr:hypothetical protein AWB71_05998 [Caballeronia peredens]
MNKNNDTVHAPGPKLVAMSLVCIEEQIAALSDVTRMSKMQIFRLNFDLWSDELKPVLRMRGLAYSAYVAQLLASCGVVVSESQVQIYLARVKKERQAGREARVLDSEIAANQVIVSATQAAIKDEKKRLVEVAGSRKLIDVFRENFDVWVGRLAPVCRANGRSYYSEIARILIVNGYEHVTPNLVGYYLSKVKKERKNG